MKVDIQVEIDDQHKLTLTTPDGKSSSKQYPISWSEQDILDDFVSGLSVKVESIQRVSEV